MTPLRRKMIEEFQIRHYASGTQKGYLWCVAQFAQHLGCPPGTIGKAASNSGAGRGVESPLKWQGS